MNCLSAKLVSLALIHRRRNEIYFGGSTYISVMPSVGLHHCYTQHMQMRSKLYSHVCVLVSISIVLVVNVRAMYSY